MNKYIVVNMVGQILGRFDTEQEGHEFADGLKHFCYIEEDDDDTYDEYGVNTKNSFNTPPKETL